MDNRQTKNTFKINSPHGREIEIPVEVDDDFDLYLKLNSNDLLDHYNNYGYVVARNVISQELCDQVIKSFEEEVKSFSGYLYRQSSEGNSPEKIALTKMDTYLIRF